MAILRAQVAGKIIKRVNGNANQGRIAKRNFKSFTGAVRSASKRILLRAMRPTFALSQKYVPVDTGALKASGFLRARGGGVIGFLTGRRDASVQIGYGLRGKPFYAIRVHENLIWRHKAPTRAKYLQSALEEDKNNITDRIQREYRI